MMMHGNRAYAQARKAFAPADIAPTLAIAQLLGYPHILAINPRRRISCVLRDYAFITISWAAFIGVILFPITQLIGLLACALALFLMPEAPQK